MRVAIVNDVEMAVEILRRILVHAPGHELAWTARNGAEAVALCARDRPDLILMDLIMPEMDGVEATRRIMAATPCPIVVVTSDMERHSSKVFEAMGAGALDAVNTPVLGLSGQRGGAHALLAKIDKVDRLRCDDGSAKRIDLAEERASRFGGDQLVAVGASAGGPTALAEILAVLPAEFPAALVVVQHVDAGFAADLAQWLGRHTKLQVRVAREGDRPRPGTVLMAGREDHLAFDSTARLHYTRIPVGGSYRPSVDVLFRSIGRQWQGETVAVLLTGMGRDGAEGLKELRDAGCHTIAQDRGSSAVYGMPKAAAELRAATDILPLNRIGPRLVKLFERRRALP